MAVWYMEARTTSATQTDVERVLLYLVRGGVLLVLLTPLIVSTEGLFPNLPDTLFPFIVGKAIFSRSVIEITFALWVMLVFAYPSYRLGRSWVLIALAVWVAMSIIAGFAGVSLQRSIWSTYERMQGIFDQVHWLAFIVVAASVFRTLTHWKLLFSANLAVSMVVALLGIGNHYGAISIDVLGGSGRIESTLGNATYVGAYAMVNILIATAMMGHSWRDRAPQADLGRAARRRRRPARQRASSVDYRPLLMAFWITATVINLWALWLALARGAFFGLLVGAVVFAIVYFLWGQIQPKKVAYGIFAVVAAMLLLFVLARATPVLDPVIESSTTLNRLASTSLSSGSVRGRLTAWRAGLRAYLDKPIFGWGPENYLIAWGRYFDSGSGIRERFDQAHNKVLEELTTKGAVGAISYQAIWAAMGWAMVRSIRRRQQYEQVFVAIVAAAMAGFFAQNLFLFDSPVTSLQFGILVAFALGEELHQRQSEGHRQGETTPVPRQPRTGGSRLAGLGYLTARVHSIPGRIAGAGLIAVILVTSLLLFNARPYGAAKAVVQTRNPAITWEQRLGLFQESIDEFPALANYPRMMLMAQVSSNIRGMSPQELDLALAIIETEAKDALDGEPESWRVEVSLARFYQIASQEIDAAYLKLARIHLDEAIRLAPRTLDVVAVLKDQEILEQHVSGQ